MFIQTNTTPFALNIGIKASTSDYATILGAHAEVSKSYFSKSVKDFQIDPKMGCTGGFLINEYEDEVSEAIGSAQSSSFGVGNAHFRTGNASGFVDTVAFGTYSRKVFEKIGYFDEELDRNQDDEFNFRLLKNGFKIYLDKDITANYYVRGSFKKLYRQYWQYGYWKVFVNVKHQMITTVRQLIPMLFVLFLAVGAVLSFVHPILRLLFFAGLGSYLLGAVFFATKKSKTPLQSAKIIFSFLILHLSYGLGYLKGIWDFMVLRKGPSKSSASLTR